MAQAIVLGGGISGLCAAAALAREGLEVLVLEARDRLGGRIHTVSNTTGQVPIELGAEFVHGAQNDLWPLIREAALETRELPARHWVFQTGELKPAAGFFEKIEQVLSRIDPGRADMSLQALLDEVQELDDVHRTLTLDYVEGFHAADPQRVSAHALWLAEQAARNDEGERTFRLAQGYRAIIEWLQRRLDRLGVEFRLGTVVESVHWEPGAVQVRGRSSLGEVSFAAGQALVTFPLGVLQDPSAVQFHPELTGKQSALSGLAMGPVVKVTLEFSEPFWSVDNFGFIHAAGRRFPTWWSHDHSALVTAWAAGPRAASLTSAGQEEIEQAAVRGLAEIFQTEVIRVRALLVASHRHDWQADPFSRGAYSYTVTGARQPGAQLAVPLADTLFFAGEATDSRGEEGTVHAAVGSGWRAAQQMVQALRRGWSRSPRVPPSRANAEH